jgi:hypothetical protein
MSSNGIALCHVSQHKINHNPEYKMEARTNNKAAPVPKVVYNPNHLLDVLLGKMQLKNDAALSRMLEVAPPVISKIRHHHMPIGASLLIRMHELTGIDIRSLRDLMGDRRRKYRLSSAQGRPTAVATPVDAAHVRDCTCAVAA